MEDTTDSPPAVCRLPAVSLVIQKGRLLHRIYLLLFDSNRPTYETHEENGAMRKIRFAMVLLLVLLVAGVVGGATIAAPQANGRTLLDTHDLSKSGTVYVMAEEGSSVPQSGPGFVTGWVDGHYTCVEVASTAQSEKVGIVGSESFRYLSATDARLAIERLQAPGTAFGFQTLAEGKALIDVDVLKLLQAHSSTWRAWYGLDREGLPGYILRFQLSNCVAELQVSVPSKQEAYGRLLLNDAVRALLRPDLTEPPSVSGPGAAIPKAGPQWYGRANAWQVWYWAPMEIGAFWHYNDAHDAHYLGPGGDALTCYSNHGCISNWYWNRNSAYYPDAILEVPKTWFFTYGDDTGYGYNWDAECWFD
jgi:hypothetical protein